MQPNASSTQFSAFDMAPLMKLYAQHVGNVRSSFGAPGGPSTAANDPFPALAPSEWQQSVQGMANQWLDGQIDFYRFAIQRLESYRAFSDALLQANSASDYSNAQMDFCSRMVSDYSAQMRKLAEPMAATVR